MFCRIAPEAGLGSLSAFEPQVCINCTAMRPGLYMPGLILATQVCHGGLQERQTCLSKQIFQLTGCKLPCTDRIQPEEANEGQPSDCGGSWGIAMTQMAQCTYA